MLTSSAYIHAKIILISEDILAVIFLSACFSRSSYSSRSSLGCRGFLAPSAKDCIDIELMTWHLRYCSWPHTGHVWTADARTTDVPKHTARRRTESGRYNRIFCSGKDSWKCTSHVYWFDILFMTSRWTRLNHVGKYIRTINQKVRTGASLPEALHFAVEFVDRKCSSYCTSRSIYRCKRMGSLLPFVIRRISRH